MDPDLDIQPILRGQDRLIVARTIIAALEGVADIYLPGQPLARGASSLVVALKVFEGTVERQPYTIEKLSHALQYPRTSVRNKLAMLIEAGSVERRGNFYVVNEQLANAPEQMEKVEHLIKTVRGAMYTIQDAVNLHALGLPSRLTLQLGR